MALFLVEEKITVEAKKDEVWKYIESFGEQQKWSPWLTAEMDAKIELSGPDSQVGTIQSWQGSVIGSGETEITHIVEGEFIDYSVRFYIPFKSRARTYLSVQKCGADCTTVLWGMEGRLPWYMGFMKKRMSSFVSADYKRGLEMLKYYAETGHNPTHIQAQGIVDHGETFTLGIERSSPVEDIPKYMSEDFQTLRDFVTTHKTGSHGARSYYTNVDMKKNLYTYRSSILLSKDEFLELSEDILSEEIQKYYYKEGKTFSLRMTGSYKFMGNAWNVLFMYLRAKKLKPNWKMPSFEDYINDPSTNPEHKYITDINIYVK